MKNLNEILKLHAEWADDNEKGKRADLWGANLWGADLRGADLRYANLRRADLRGADLVEADLGGAKNIMQFGPMPTSGRTLVVNWHGQRGWLAWAGCFSGGLDELEAAVKEKHNCPAYLGIIGMLRAHTPS